MNIPIKVKSKKTGRIVEGSFTPRQLLELLDEDELVTKLTMCQCHPVGETNVIECNCDEEWDDYVLLIGDEITAQR
ncbi:acetyltransferase [[Brevibacterium] frigoritolerans]|nr:acetyltransferase [Peribacillus frigoritolerans]